ncbi:restriction endonuclease subunit S [Schaalia dentiphila]|jgi:Restriction endonuclease S subunits|uniref:Type I restriction modification DNA specificity domain protein n=1 Tax=Schaalia dentiphila ATCC 17982 TaxID=411466 RepID=A7B8U5_9ACTO|nr:MULTISPECIES: restriction endonuclease subunit S [Schaalia]EDN79619.1 type I restriction modification DNA specificity domain protein [Schaalia odontolytica ATCC 17982]
MSRLADLIAELCPDGVEYRALGDVAELKRGEAVTRKEVVEGQVPVIAGGREPAYYIDRSNRQGETIVIAGSGAYAGFVSFWDEPIFVSDAFSIVVDRSVLQPRFVYHWLSGRQEAIHALKSGGGVPHVYPKDVAKLRCPVPPLEVQREIVRILDQFTTLEAELEAELEARRTQYAHYRTHLLSYESLAARGPVNVIELQDVGVVRMCKRIHKAETSIQGDIPFFKISTFGGTPTSFISAELYGKYKDKYPYPKKGDLLISAAGTIGQIVRFDGADAYFQDSNIVWLEHDESIVLNRYLYYVYLNTRWTTDGGTIKRLYNNRILQQQICVPPIETQITIADLLDRFDALVNDISSGLPAEIAARRAQYEHYRDRLLSFPEKKAE